MLDEKLQAAWDLLTEAGARFSDRESRMRACEAIARAMDRERRDAERLASVGRFRQGQQRSGRREYA